GEWLPEPLIDTGEKSGAARVELDESVRMAFLVLLERLSPVQRAVFLLRDVFDYEYTEIARILGKSEAAVRQTALRARAHVLQERPRFDVEPERQSALIDRFFAAIEEGDVASLETLLAADASLHGDGGGRVPALARPVRGRSAVAQTLLNWARTGARARFSMKRTTVNHQPGALICAADGSVIGAQWPARTAGSRRAALSLIPTTSGRCRRREILASGCGARSRSAVRQRLDPRLRAPVVLTPDGLAALVAFVRDGLLDPDDRPERLRKLIPDRLPSGRKGFDFQV